MASTQWNSTTQLYDLDPYWTDLLSYSQFRATFLAAWLGAMIPIGICFHGFTAKEQKQTNLFRVQVFCILLAIFYNLSEIGNQVYIFEATWVKPERQWKYTFFSIWISSGNMLDHLIPVFSDSALLFRLYTFFPFPVFSKNARLYIFSPFYILLIIRGFLSIFIGVIYTCQQLIGAQWIDRRAMKYSIDLIWTSVAYDYAALVEDSLAALYCLLASSILIYKARKVAKARISTNNRKRVQTRMQFFAEALVMCFVPPIFISMASGFQLFCSSTKYIYYRETQTLKVNLSVIFSILATSWPGIRESLSRENRAEERIAFSLSTGNNNPNLDLGLVGVEGEV